MLYCLTILLHYLSRRLRPQSWTWWAYSLINQSFRLISEYANYLLIYPGHFVLRAVNYHVALRLLVVQRLIIIDKWFLNSGYYIGSWELNVPTKNDGTKYWHTMEPYEVYLPLASRLDLHVMLTVLALPVYWQWVLRLSHSSPTYHKICFTIVYRWGDFFLHDKYLLEILSDYTHTCRTSTLCCSTAGSECIIKAIIVCLITTCKVYRNAGIRSYHYIETFIPYTSNLWKLLSQHTFIRHVWIAA